MCPRQSRHRQTHQKLTDWTRLVDWWKDRVIAPFLSCCHFLPDEASHQFFGQGSRGTGGSCVFGIQHGKTDVSAEDESTRWDNCRIGAKCCLLCQAESVPGKTVHAQWHVVPQLMLTLSNETLNCM